MKSKQLGTTEYYEEESHADKVSLKCRVRVKKKIITLASTYIYKWMISCFHEHLF